MIRANFIMEQHVGLRSYYENLRRFIDESKKIEANWEEITYEEPGLIWDRLPLLPDHWRGALVGRSQTRRGLSQHSYDVAFFHTQVPAALGGRLVTKRPYILCTDITPIQYDQLGPYYDHKADGNGLLSRYKHRTNVQLFHNAARVLSYSNWARDSLICDYGLDGSNVEVLPPGVDIEKWQPKDGTDDNIFRILFIGYDLDRKGGNLLLEAFRALPANLTELILVTRSFVPEERGVKLYNEMQPNSAELIALSQSCDVFVLPTKAEAFGIAAVEASALGLPVIATTKGGLGDIVVDGETGFLIQPGDKQMLVSRLRLLLEDPTLRQKLGQAARERIVKHFNARQNATRVIEILEEVVNNGH
ncbi:MAG: glycosyltransferase family 4 protein [Chloroflexota bacterium]|jgi:glycosyltransferase involved in cell wall biosynthesis